MPPTTLYPKLTPFEILFNRGVTTSKDATVIKRNALAEGVNINLTNKSYPTQCSGQQRFNPSVIAAGQPIKGQCAFVGEDGVNYIIVACNGGFYWSNGNGTFTAVTYKNDGTALTISTSSYWYNFQEFWDSTSGTQKKIVLAITNSYPIVTNTNGTQAANCTTSRAIYFYLSSGVVYAKNVFYNTSVALDTMIADTGWTQGNATPTITENTTAGQSAGSNGGVNMAATASGAIDMYKTYSSFSATGKTVSLTLFPPSLANVDFVYIKLQSASNYWSEFIFPVANLTANILQVITFDLTTTYAVGSSGAANLAAIVQVTIGVHTTASQAISYTFSLLGVSAAGSDDIQCGSQSNTPPDSSWPEQGKYICRIFDKILVANYANFTNGYAVSQARDALNWTNPTGSIDIGGGTNPEPFTACIAYNTSVLLFIRDGILNVNATPGDLSTWREQWLNTNLGNVGNQVCLNNDGWVYFMSQQGVARTDGRIAELVCLEIQDQFNLAQLLANNLSVMLDQNSDWKAGLIGAYQIDDTQAQLQQFIFDQQFDWVDGNSTNIDYVTTPNAEQLFLGLTNITPGTNISGTGTASSNADIFAGYPSTNANSGNICKIGSIAGAPYWQLTFSQALPIGEISFIAHLNGWAIGPQYIAYSTDNSNWTTITSTPTSQVGDAYYYIFPTVSAKYWRILFPDPVDWHSYIDLFSVGFFCYYPTSGGALITPVIDYGEVPTTYGNLSAQVNVPAGCSMTFYLLTSPDNNTWSSPISLANVPGGTVGNVSFNLPTPANRFIKIQSSLFTDSTFSLTPNKLKAISF